jgi:hypothetical protein
LPSLTSDAGSQGEEKRGASLLGGVVRRKLTDNSTLPSAP